MTAKQVEAVWVWRYTQAAFKSTYGRLPDGQDQSYSKDYLQVSGDCAVLLGRAFPFSSSPDRVDIQYQWPEGTSSGFIKHPNDRYHLSWPTGGAPAPWKLTPAPNATTVQTIPGDPGQTTTVGANQVWATLDASGIVPYLVAVKLSGEQTSLHLRVYLDNTEQHPQLQFASVNLLPPAVRSLVYQTSRSRACASAGFDNLFPDTVKSLVDKLRANPNLLLIGPPGTGKSVMLEELVRYVNQAPLVFDPARRHDAWSEAVHHGKSRTVVLHPNYGYDNLVVGLMPTVAESGVTVRAVTGPLVNLAHYASESGRLALLVLDEFNRGNAASALGDTLALLDKDKRSNPHAAGSGATVDLPYSDLNLTVPDEFAANGSCEVPTPFRLPEGLWIVAAMNTSDRSIAPLDAALRRRFTILEIPPNYAALREHLEANDAADLVVDWANWTTQHVSELAVRILESINARITAVLGTDFQIGPSCFWDLEGDTADERLYRLTLAFDGRLVRGLRMSLQDDDGPLGAILRAEQPGSAVSSAGHTAYWSEPDPGLGDFGQPRLLIRETSGLRLAARLQELLRQANVV